MPINRTNKRTTRSTRWSSTVRRGIEKHHNNTRSGGREDRGGQDSDVYRVVEAAIYGADYDGVGIYIWTYVEEDEIDSTKAKLSRRLGNQVDKYNDELNLNSPESKGSWRYQAHSTQKVDQRNKLNIGIQISLVIWNETGDIEWKETKTNSKENWEPPETK